MGIRVGTFEKGVCRPIIFVVDTKFDIGVSCKKSDDPTQCDGKRGKKTDNRNRDTQNGEYPSANHPTNGNGYKFFKSEVVHLAEKRS